MADLGLTQISSRYASTGGGVKHFLFGLFHVALNVETCHLYNTIGAHGD